MKIWKQLSMIVLAALLGGMLVCTLEVRRVTAVGYIYIRADGSVDPPEAPISTTDYITYTFTGDIADQIVVERDNIVIDGAGYTVDGAGLGGWGVSFSGRTNVTVKNMTIMRFTHGVHMVSSGSSTISGNNITANTECGICLILGCSDNRILGNNMTANYQGIAVDDSCNNNSLADNIAAASTVSGILLARVSDLNTILNNTITNNYYGLTLDSSSNNTICDNRVTGNVQQGILISSNSNYNGVSGNNVTDGNEVGIQIGSAYNNSISDNRVTANTCGMVLGSCSNNSIFLNNITDNYEEGVYVSSSSWNNISGNNMMNNLDALWLVSACNNSVADNLVTGNSGGIYLSTSADFNSISGNNLTYNGYGIKVNSAYSNNISYNHVEGSQYAVYFVGASSNNDVSRNRITDSSCGVYLEGSDNNTIWHNDFWRNGIDALCYLSTDAWNVSYPTGGNYWDDYVGKDVFKGPDQNEEGSDGIGDTPYWIYADNVDHYPLMTPVFPLPDVAVASVEPSKNFVSESFGLEINATVINHGIGVQTFNLTVYANETVVGGCTNFVLESGTNANFTFPWSVVGFARGSYAIKVCVEPVPGEEDIKDNNCSGGWVVVSISGDVNGDRIVDIYDAIRLSNAYGTEPGMDGWDPNADINNDGFVDIYDAILLSNHYNESYL